MQGERNPDRLHDTTVAQKTHLRAIQPHRAVFGLHATGNGVISRVPINTRPRQGAQFETMMNAVQITYRLRGTAIWPAGYARAEGSAITW